MGPYLSDFPYLNYWIDKETLIAPHNMFLSVGVEFGLIGLFLYSLIILLTVLSLLKTILEHYKKKNPINRGLLLFSQMAFVTLIAGLVQGMVLSVHLNKHIWFILGFTLSISVITKYQRVYLIDKSTYRN